MTDHRIVFTNPDNSVGVIVPTPQHVAELMASGLTEDEAVLEIAAKDTPPEALNSRITTIADIPDRTFRNAWIDLGSGPVGLDIAKAKKIAHEKRRQHLAEQLKPLETEETLDLPDAARQAQIAQERQTLRGNSGILKNAIDAATNEAELRAALAGII